MSYQVLARKWRPKSFEELVGQKQTAKALINALESQRLHHAYLFTGTRGVGKTTIARILSKSLNCEKGITSQPCGECSSCIEIDQGNFVDLMEIDAASKTKVEDTRELLDNVQYRPTRGRYKVYLIDEVHMLSGHSFNALLKTLEEPPPHVIFLLATTDPQKLPVTVLSRCLQFHLKRMEQTDIVTHLSMILNAENITFEPSALNPIAKGADGSMRDALSLLDQAIAFSGEHLQTASVLEMLGSIDQSYCFQLLESIQNNDAAAMMVVIKDMSQYSPDYFEVMSDWLSLLHNIAVAQAIGYSDNEEILALSKNISSVNLQLYYQLSLQAKKDMPYAPHPRQGFEMALLRVIAFKPVTSPHSPDGVKKKLIDSELEASKVEPLTTKQPKPVNTEQDTLEVAQRLPQEQEHLPQSISLGRDSAVQKIKSELHQPLTEPLDKQRFKEQGQSENAINHPGETKIRLVSDNVEFIQQESNGSESLNSSSHINDKVLQPSRLNLNESESKESIGNKSPLRQVKEIGSNVDSIYCQLENNDLENSNHQSKRITNSETVLNTTSEQLYPTVSRVSLSAVCFDNWHYVVDQLPIAANGIQVLLNSMAKFNNEVLSINHLEKVGHFLTDNLRESLGFAIKEHFSSDAQRNNFKVEFNSVKELPETPKIKQIKLHEAAIESAYQQLINDPCVSKLQQGLGAMLDKKTISLK